KVAADDAHRWVPRGSEYHRPDDVGLAAVAITPATHSGVLHSHRVVPYFQTVIGSAYAAGTPRSDSIPDPVVPSPPDGVAVAEVQGSSIGQPSAYRSSGFSGFIWR